MLLGHNIMTTIEGLLERGHTVELRIEGGPDEERVTVVKRPDSEDVIPIHPTLASEAVPTNLTLRISKPGQDPVMLGTITLPAGFVISGIKGHQGISQEIKKG